MGVGGGYLHLVEPFPRVTNSMEGELARKDELDLASEGENGDERP